jgi:hypothetical protein
MYYEVMVEVNDIDLVCKTKNIASDLYNEMFGKPEGVRVAYFRNEVSAFIWDANKVETYLTALLVRLESAGIAVGKSRTRSLGIQGE